MWGSTRCGVAPVGGGGGEGSTRRGVAPDGGGGGGVAPDVG